MALQSAFFPYTLSNLLKSKKTHLRHKQLLGFVASQFIKVFGLIVVAALVPDGGKETFPPAQKMFFFPPVCPLTQWRN